MRTHKTIRHHVEIRFRDVDAIRGTDPSNRRRFLTESVFERSPKGPAGTPTQDKRVWERFTFTPATALKR